MLAKYVAFLPNIHTCLLNACTAEDYTLTIIFPTLTPEKSPTNASGIRW